MFYHTLHTCKLNVGAVLEAFGKTVMTIQEYPKTVYKKFHQKLNNIVKKVQQTFKTNKMQFIRTDKKLAFITRKFTSSQKL